MLTKRENMMETLKGGNPDRFVKQYEAFEIIMAAPMAGPMPMPGETVKNAWGITFSWPEGQLGSFPVHDDEHRVLKDITKWKEVVIAPPIETSDEAWAAAVAHAESIDRKDKFVTAFIAPGLFEMTHHLMGVEDALMSFYEEPEAMEELIEYLTDYELRYAEEYLKHIKVDAILHHDDWGSQISTFMSPAMFEDFLLPSYKKIYKFWKDNGVEVIMHHSDSYAATLIPYMIEMGIDVWQGVMNTNDIPAVIEKHGKDITFMGGLHSGLVDFPTWTPELIAKQVEESCKANGYKYFIPCQTSGLPIESFPGVNAAIDEAIDKMSQELIK
ncbi:uroporphyrinogen decarboxylase family protein [Eubacteriaceae bacterium ES3]|nr:uroporphyrinogen decarboxylase family protein [Eubacteriaceae bacterium ES3]